MGIQERKAREKRELRQEILAAARDLFAEQGFQAVSMRKIAERIEYSPTTIYLHFRDKNDLFDCLCEQTFAKLVRKFELLEKCEDPLLSLRKGLRAFIDFGLKHPQDYQVTFLMNDGRDAPEEAVGRHQLGCLAFEKLERSVGAAIDSGHLQPIDTHKAAEILWAGVHGLTSLLIVHPKFPWTNKSELIEAMIDALLRGLERREPCRCS